MPKLGAGSDMVEGHASVEVKFKMSTDTNTLTWSLTRFSRIIARCKSTTATGDYSARLLMAFRRCYNGRRRGHIGPVIAGVRLPLGLGAGKALILTSIEDPRGLRLLPGIEREVVRVVPANMLQGKCSAILRFLIAS